MVLRNSIKHARNTKQSEFSFDDISVKEKKKNVWQQPRTEDVVSFFNTFSGNIVSIIHV